MAGNIADSDVLRRAREWRAGVPADSDVLRRAREQRAGVPADRDVLRRARERRVRSQRHPPREEAPRTDTHLHGHASVGVAHRTNTATDLKLRANPTRSHSDRLPPRRPRLPSAAAAAAARTSRH